MGIKNIYSGNSGPQWNTLNVCNHDTKYSKSSSFKGTTIPTIHINRFAEKKWIHWGQESAEVYFFVHVINQCQCLSSKDVINHFEEFKFLNPGDSQIMSCFYRANIYLCIILPQPLKLYCWAHGLFQSMPWSEWLIVHSDQAGLWYLLVPPFRCNLKVSECIRSLKNYCFCNL